jgi:hypothetical protein
MPLVYSKIVFPKHESSSSLTTVAQNTIHALRQAIESITIEQLLFCYQRQDGVSLQDAKRQHPCNSYRDNTPVLLPSLYFCPTALNVLLSTILKAQDYHMEVPCVKHDKHNLTRSDFVRKRDNLRCVVEVQMSAGSDIWYDIDTKFHWVANQLQENEHMLAVEILPGPHWIKKNRGYPYIFEEVDHPRRQQHNTLPCPLVILGLGTTPAEWRAMQYKCSGQPDLLILDRLAWGAMCAQAKLFARAAAQLPWAVYPADKLHKKRKISESEANAPPLEMQRPSKRLRRVV